MIWSLALFIAAVVSTRVIAYYLAKAPVGYEDESGFHLAPASEGQLAKAPTAGQRAVARRQTAGLSPFTVMAGETEVAPSASFGELRRA